MKEYFIQDMTCGRCARLITQAVTELDPQAILEIDIKTKRVRIESAESTDNLSAKIVDAGYTPIPL